MKLLSTRACAQLWKLQEEVRSTGRERERLFRTLHSGRMVLTLPSHRDLWLEFSCADQEYRFAVSKLEEFVQRHSLDNDCATTGAG